MGRKISYRAPSLLRHRPYYNSGPRDFAKLAVASHSMSPPMCEHRSVVPMLSQLVPCELNTAPQKASGGVGPSTLASDWLSPHRIDLVCRELALSVELNSMEMGSIVKCIVSVQNFISSQSLTLLCSLIILSSPDFTSALSSLSDNQLYCFADQLQAFYSTPDLYLTTSHYLLLPLTTSYYLSLPL